MFEVKPICNIFTEIRVVTSEDDIYVSIGDEGIKWLAKALTPGAYIVDYLPWRELHFIKT